MFRLVTGWEVTTTVKTQMFNERLHQLPNPQLILLLKASIRAKEELQTMSC